MNLLRAFFFLMSSLFFAQEGFQLTNNREKTEIPFRFISNLIFLPVTVNGIEMTFMLDSGIGETILFSFENKEVSFKDIKKITFRGLGGQAEVEGFEAIENQVNVGSEFLDSNHRIYIIINELFNISTHVGIPVNGVIGYHFFKNHPIKIDYEKRKITIFKPSTKIKTRNYTQYPITVENSKPYIESTVHLANTSETAKMLLDLGNSDPLWIFPNKLAAEIKHKVSIHDYLGRGFNGDIFGTRTRIAGFSLGKYTFNQPHLAIPDPEAVQNVLLVPGRKGSVGDEILRRFDLIFDYPNSRLFLKPNSSFSDRFYLDMSGLTIKNNGVYWEKEWVRVINPSSVSDAAQQSSAYSYKGDYQYSFSLKNEFTVSEVRPNSPAQLAGLIKDDLLVRINSIKASELTLEQIITMLKKSEGSKIRLEIIRKGQPLKFEFVLKDPIPYSD